MSDLTFLSAVAMAQKIREKKISPVELADAHLATIERLNPKLNAFVHVDPGGRPEDVLLALTVVDARSLHVGTVRHLVVVEAEAGIETKLVLGIGIVDERSKGATS